MTTVMALVFVLCPAGAFGSWACEDGIITARLSCAALERHVREGLRPGQTLAVTSCQAVQE